MFSEELKQRIETESGLQLNPSYYNQDWKRTGSADEVLASQLSNLKQTGKQLTCGWVSNMDMHSGIITNISLVTSQQKAEAEVRFKELGYTPIEEFGGKRYVWEKSSLDGPVSPSMSGESHVFRENFWFATSWLQYGPTGYSEEIVKNFFNR